MADFVAYKGNRISKQSVFIAYAYKNVSGGGGGTAPLTLPSIGQLYPRPFRA